MFGSLDVELAEGLLGQLQGGEVKVMSLLKKALLSLLIVAVDGDFLQNER